MLPQACTSYFIAARDVVFDFLLRADAVLLKVYLPRPVSNICASVFVLRAVCQFADSCAHGVALGDEVLQHMVYHTFP